MLLRAFGTCELNAANDDCCQRRNGMTWNGFSFQKQEIHIRLSHFTNNLCQTIQAMRHMNPMARITTVDRHMTHRKVALMALTFLSVGVALLLSPGCTSTLKAVTGTYSYYEVIDGKVTYFRWNPMAMRYHTRVLEDADPDTFEAIGREHGKDATTVYEWDIPILHADPASYKRLSDGYSKDATQVFYGRKRLEGADLATFERLGDGWSRDVDDVYSGNRRLEICDIDTFEHLSIWRALDSQCYYIKGNRLDIVDRTSLEILWGVFAKDQSHVYWLQHVVDGADPKTFEIKDDRMQSLARDADQCFIGPDVVTCDELNPEGQEYCRC